MESNGLNRQEIIDMLAQLEQAKHNHLQWHKEVIRTIACRLHPNQHDINENAHKECQFGQWYYGYAASRFYDLSGFISLGDAHEQMHKSTRELLLSLDTEGHVNAYDYDSLANSIERLQLEINTLMRELEQSLYTRDPLTGAINRVDMMPVLRELHEMAKRNAMTSSIVMVDLDHFKVINDKYGHVFGDKVLREVCQFFIKNIRAYDKIFRFGGEEFLICMLQTDVNSCFDRSEELRKGLGALKIQFSDKEDVNITASFGITLLDKQFSLESNIEHVDQAMYSAKNNGRNNTKIWHSDSN